MDKYKAKDQIKGWYKQNKEVDNDKLEVKKIDNQDQGRKDKLWNLNTSLLVGVCDDDVVQKNNESSTTKPYSWEKETPIKTSMFTL